METDTDTEAVRRDEIKRTLRCFVTCAGLVGLAFFAALLLASCQSQQDRQWSDMQTILEMTQPQRGR